jgi:hypothetical protein
MTAEPPSSSRTVRMARGFAMQRAPTVTISRASRSLSSTPLAAEMSFTARMRSRWLAGWTPPSACGSRQLQELSAQPAAGPREATDRGRHCRTTHYRAGLSLSTNAFVGRNPNRPLHWSARRLRDPALVLGKREATNAAPGQAADKLLGFIDRDRRCTACDPIARAHLRDADE